MQSKTAAAFKRNTTPTLPITVNIPLSRVRRLEFVFKSKCTESHPVLLHKVFNAGEIPVDDSVSTEVYFKVLLTLNEKETAVFQPGEIYMDTRIELTDGTVPETGIIILEVTPSLFEDGE